MKYAVILICLATISLVACSTAPVERAVSVTTKPDFIWDPGLKTYCSFRVSGPNGKRSIFWPDSAPKPDLLNKDRFYTLELLEVEGSSSGNDSRFISRGPELYRVYDGTTLMYDASICSKHHLQMDRKLVKISYGFPSFSPERIALRENAPNDGTVLGVNRVSEKQMETRAWVCPICKSVYDEAMARMKSEKR
jgi:hypothetical protein